MNTEAIRFIAKAILAQNTVLRIRYGELVRHGLLHRRLDQLSHH